MSSAAPEQAGAETSSGTGGLPGFVDWLLAAFVALVGLALVVGGSALTLLLDADALREGIESGEIASTTLTEAELLDVSLATTNWTGIGLLVTGVAMVVLAVAYVIVRRRARQRVTDGTRVGSPTTNALLGAVISAIFGFIPFSPLLGGGVAGYLEQRESERTVSVGALSGVLWAAPLLVILTFVSVGLVIGLAGVSAPGLATVVGTAMLLTLFVVAILGAGAGALGGYLGGWVAADRRAEPSS